MTTTTVDPVSRWLLDLNGDTYGDERERLRWYEGIAMAASLQWIGVPLAAAILVWVLGRPSVLPLAVVLAVMYVPTVLVLVYVQRHRVNPMLAYWSPGRILHGSLAAGPYLAFVLGAMRAYSTPQHPFFPAAIYGLLIGLALAVAILAGAARLRRRREGRPVPDED